MWSLRRASRQKVAAKAVAAVIAAAAPSVSFSTAAEAFTDRQCLVIDRAFMDYVRGNAARFSNEDKAEFRKFGEWLSGGCRGNITLIRRPEVAAAMHAVQTQLANMPTQDLRVSLAGRVTLG